MTLYDIDQRITDLVDDETGEVKDIGAFEDLQMERSEKIENALLYIKNLRADAAAYKAEAKSFQDKEKAAESKIKSLKSLVSYALDGERFKTERVTASYRKSVSVDIVAPEMVPDAYIRTKVETSPDKTAIKQAIQSGNAVPGCELVEKQNLQIK